MPKGPSANPRTVNKKVRYNFEVLETEQAGIVLTGSEVKSLRAGRASLDEGYACIRNGEAWLIGCNISPYPMAGCAQHDPDRERKLLLHRRQIRKWQTKVTQRGMTIVPLALYFSERGIAKIDLGLARGKSHADKRQTIKKRDQERDVRRELRRRR